MKKKVLKPWTMAACMLALMPMYAQVSTPFNQGVTGDFVGWDNTMTNDPLEIRHDANQPIDWYTNAIQRMRLYPDQVGNIPLFTGGTVPVQQNGFLGLSGTPAFFAPGSYGPFTRLHLVDESPAGSGIFYYAQPWSYRTWMRNPASRCGAGSSPTWVSGTISA